MVQADLSKEVGSCLKINQISGLGMTMEGESECSDAHFEKILVACEQRVIWGYCSMGRICSGLAWGMGKGSERGKGL
jgi:hypothetical protein